MIGKREAPEIAGDSDSIAHGVAPHQHIPHTQTRLFQGFQLSPSSKRGFFRRRFVKSSFRRLKRFCRCERQFDPSSPFRKVATWIADLALTSTKEALTSCSEPSESRMAFNAQILLEPLTKTSLCRTRQPTALPTDPALLGGYGWKLAGSAHTAARTKR